MDNCLFMGLHLLPLGNPKKFLNSKKLFKTKPDW